MTKKLKYIELKTEIIDKIMEIIKKNTAFKKLRKILLMKQLHVN